MSSSNYKTRFESDGYLVVDGLLSPDEVARSIHEIERLHTVARIDPGQDFEVEPFAKNSEEEGRLILRKMERTWKYSEWFDAMARHPQLVPILTEILGPQLLLFRSTLMLKPARHGSIHGFHQDTSYWPMDPPHLVTVSIALTDATPDNGCIQVIPGSHTWGTRDIEEWGGIARDQSSTLTDRKDIDTSAAIHVPLKAGSALFFHSAVVHGSGPNRSSNPRNTALYAYFTPDVKYVPRQGKPREQTYRVVAGMGETKEVKFLAEEPDN